MTRIVVPVAQRGQRLDRALATLWGGGLSRAEAQRWIDAGAVTVDGGRAEGAKKLRGGEALVVTPPPPPVTEASPDPSVRFDTLFEDAHLLVLDKPPHLVVHPAAGHADGTLVNGLLARGGFELDGDDHTRPGIVHRLDKGTSGVMVVAKTAAAREGLTALFAAHDIDRAYLAICVGVPRDGTITTTHGRHPTDRLRFTSRLASGKRAVTHVRVVRPLARGAALVECTLETGRTHQIRLHLAEVAQAPVLGDPVYGARPRDAALRALGQALGRQALHAARLGFVHPITGASLAFTTPPPSDMQRALDELS